MTPEQTEEIGYALRIMVEHLAGYPVRTWQSTYGWHSAAHGLVAVGPTPSVSLARLGTLLSRQ